MRVIIFIIVNICFLTVNGQSKKNNINIDTKLLSYYIDSKNEVFNLTYSIANLSNETQYLWFSTNEVVNNNDLIKEFFFSPKGGSCFYQIAMETNATFEHVLFESFIKKIDSGSFFDLEFVSRKEISEKEITEIVNFLNQTIVVMSESEITKEIKGFQAFNPNIYYASSSLPLFVETFLKTIGKMKKQDTLP